MERKALFIINPISGGKKKDGVPELIEQHLDLKLFKPTIVFSDGVAHAKQIAKEAIGKFDVAVAVGGDGTINEVASSIVGSDIALGIVPFGSGNGLARFLKIPLDTRKAIQNLGTGKVVAIDSATLNGKPFFNMAGMGFDAHIAEVFSHTEKRGFISYIKSSLQEIATYKAQHYHLVIDGKPYDRDAFMLSFANSSQFGNDAHVAPQASIQDGLLDVCVIKQFPLWRFPEMAVRMMTKTADKSKFVEIIRGQHIVVTREQAGAFHLDGEPQVGGIEANIILKPHSLKVVAGKDFV